MIELDNQSTFTINIELLESIAQNQTSKEIELIIADNVYIQNINKEFRNKDYATDVLSFPIEDSFGISPLGSIIISMDFVEEKAKEYGHSMDEELALLFIHGLLHLLGYDHEIDKGEMRKKEEEMIRYFALPLSLIVRNS